MDRLFGRKTKKSSTTNPVNTSPSNPVVTNEDEGFAIVNPAPPMPTPYPILNASATVASAAPASVAPTISGGTSSSAFLDGIPFALSSKCQGGGSSDLDDIVARVENIAERVRSVDWSAANYDFRLERSVLSQDPSLSLQGLHLD